ncbi:MAG: hypothetical protein IPH12_13470 [Saprospirales bacterium]|nr:hypothetical protein [Saprospirales bacterium]MBK8922753.1 hypothetical protein [Saprospirales bacterium]
MKKLRVPFLLMLVWSLVFAFQQNALAQAGGTKPELVMYRHNGSNGTSPLPVVQGNLLGTLKWTGLTAIGNNQTGASIKSIATGPVSAGIMSSNMIFSTQNTGALYDRMIITENGLVGIGTMNPQFHLHVVGNTHTTGDFFGRIHMDNNADTDDAPNTYIDEAYFERKRRSVLGVPAGAGLSDFGGALTLSPGGLNAYDHQLFFGQDGIYNRREANAAAAWSGAWEKLLSSADIKGTPNRIARFLPPDNPSSKLGDSQLFDNGTNVVVGPPLPAAPVFDPADRFTVNGATRLNGNTRLTNNLTVDAATTTNSLSVTTATSTGSLDVSGQANFGQSVKIGPGATFASGYSLSVAGGIMTNEVNVQVQPWPDYVFAGDYPLQPLTEVEQFIRENNHLPNVVSAQEVTERGLNLGEMQKAQMEKIEELFLHLIALEKRVSALEAQNKQLEQENAALNAAAKH